MIKRALIILVLALCIFPGKGHCATVREMYEQAVDQYNQKHFQEAIDLYQEILKEAPNFAPAYVGIGLCLKGKGADADEVLYYYKTAVERDPTNTQALDQLGRLYYSLNQYDKAEKVLLKALKIDPALTSAKLSLAWIYLMGRSKPELAIKYFKETLKVNQDPEIYFGLGMAYFAVNERVEAIDMVTQLRALGSDEYAKRLEQAIRENKRVVTNNSSGSQEQAQDPKALERPVGNTNVKVRLRGRLSDIE